MLRPVRDLRWPCARHARDQLAMRAAAPTTWALCAQCARDLVLGVRTVHTAQFCDNALFRVTVWILFMVLFMNTVHRVKKFFFFKYKIFKNFLCMI